MMIVGSSNTEVRIARGSDKSNSAIIIGVSGTGVETNEVFDGGMSEFVEAPTGDAEKLHDGQIGLNAVIFLHGAQKERLLFER
jgi:hypothetical protein